MTEDISQIKVNEHKKLIQAHWKKLSNADLEQINGNVEELINLLRRRYGYGKVQAQIEINNWLEGLKKQRKTS